VIGREDLWEDERFQKTSGRLVHRDALIPELERALKTRPSAAWLEGMEAGGIPCGPINNYKQVFEDPQVQHRGLWQQLPHPEGGMTPTIASPLRLSETPVQYRMAAPTLGQHTQEILRNVLGKSQNEIDQLGDVIG
jgi:crotonobetainyl-CoA:carnitine CoA-transferase CaiB-like acyl-CoA transferase